MPAKIGQGFLTSSYYESLAIVNYQQYLVIQEKIDKLEEAAATAASHYKRAQSYILGREDTDAGFKYKSMCGERDRFMQLAQLNASMAIMLRDRDSRIEEVGKIPLQHKQD
jgi:hypothetical protein